MMQRVLLAGGGTGGHLFPGVAVCEELRRRLPDLDVLFVGSDRGIEARVLPSLDERFQAIEVRPLMGRGALELAKNLAALPRSAAHALSLVRGYRPDLASGLGGYVAGPILLSAAALRIPTALLEQNAHVGLTNRLLAPVVGRAYLTYEATAAQFGPRRARVLGNPVRRSFVEAARMARHDPVGVAARSRSILVLGGSQGARALNRAVPEALSRAGVAELGIAVLHQSGAEMVDEVARRYAELGINASVVPFIDDIVRAYVGATLVIARAGATTLAELCAVGCPSILVPYPYAADDHQSKNAAVLERAGAAVMLREPELTLEALSGSVAAVLRDPERRRAMAEAALSAGRPDAAAAIVDDLLQWLGVPNASVPEPEPERPSLGDAGEPPRESRRRRARGQLRVRCIDESIDAAG
jgi:UDP-N-acetylglucosamine--N-acetylmuramyl-(pentapeptide) pyrophosphoryl-undecaprenol N-acetylglucosamine transferase